MGDRAMFEKLMNGGKVTQPPPAWISRLPTSGGLMSPTFQSPVMNHDGGLMTDFNMLAQQLSGMNNNPAAGAPAQAPNQRAGFGGILDQLLRYKNMQPVNNRVQIGVGAAPEAMSRYYIANMGTRG